jgi:hypothetical protein
MLKPVPIRNILAVAVGAHPDIGADEGGLGRTINHKDTKTLRKTKITFPSCLGDFEVYFSSPKLEPIPN